MPSISERLRRPLDEAMLLRLVMAARLVSADELTRFYAEGGAKPGAQPLHKFLAERGVDVRQLEAVKRAYAETVDFGTLMLRFLNSHGAEDSKIRAVNRALNACETAQLMAIKKGKRARPIGEMMVELGHITATELETIVAKQGLCDKIEHYAEESRVRHSLAARLGLATAAKRALAIKIAVAALASAAVLVLVFNLWFGGLFQPEADPETEAFGGAFEPANTERHIVMIQQHYGNMLGELRLGNARNARHYQAMIEKYFKAMEIARVSVDDQAVQHIKQLHQQMDFSKLDRIPARDLPGMPAVELEARLRK